MKSLFNLFFLFITISISAQSATNKSNALKLKIIEERNEQLKTQHISDSLDEEINKQYGNIDDATMDPGQKTIDDEFGNTARINQNQDMSQQPQAKDMDEIHKSSLAKLTDSMPPVLVYTLLGFVVIVIFRFLFGKRG
ncbi:hypothetical protein [Flavobacterium sp. ZB4P13]|uniref:hypothetical protein n=1 Tax=Flavobacterium sp. ZB4P13 TaxID=3401728 RepID=UPI003AAE230E